jgi:uncharacterized protein YlxW (UPF0749 family)
VIYCAFFLVVAFLIHLKDVENVASKSHVIILVAVASISVDVGFLCLSEFITLLSISVLPQDPLSIAKLLILGAMPGSLGVVTLNSLTASSLRERASKLNREVKELTKQVQDLDKHREQRQTEFNEFKKKTRTFMKAVGKDKDAQ